MEFLHKKIIFFYQLPSVCKSSTSSIDAAALLELSSDNDERTNALEILNSYHNNCKERKNNAKKKKKEGRRIEEKSQI